MDQRIFTDSYIRSLKPQDATYKRSEYAPRGEGRLIVRVLPNGTKEFFYRYRVDGLDETKAIGRYDTRGKNGKTLGEIRSKAKEYAKKQAQTGNLKEYLRAEARRKVLAARQGSFKQLLLAYTESLRSSGKLSADQIEGIFKRHVFKPFPSLADTKASKIESEDIQRILNRMVRKGIRRQVNMLRSYLHAAFAFGGKADHDPRTNSDDGVKFGLKGNPVMFIPRIAEYENEGDRHLSDEELRRFWIALDSLPLVQRTFLRFNLAIGVQRASQLLRVGWEDFDFEGNTLLLRDPKGRGGIRDHLIPLTPFALEQLQPLIELNGAGTIPFTSDGNRRMVVETLSQAVRQLSDELEEAKNVPSFRLGDLRRTSETMLGALGVSKEIRAHVLSHGRTTGVQAKHYDRYTYLDEKREALERWAEKLQRIIDPTRKANVVAMPKRRVS